MFNCLVCITLPVVTLQSGLWALWCPLFSDWLWQWQGHHLLPTRHWDAKTWIHIDKHIIECKDRHMLILDGSATSLHFLIWPAKICQRPISVQLQLFKINKNLHVFPSSSVMSVLGDFNTSNWCCWRKCNKMMIPFWHSVVGCGQNSCFGVTYSCSSKLEKH